MGARRRRERAAGGSIHPSAAFFSPCAILARLGTAPVMLANLPSPLLYSRSRSPSISPSFPFAVRGSRDQPHHGKRLTTRRRRCLSSRFSPSSFLYRRALCSDGTRHVIIKLFLFLPLLALRFYNFFSRETIITIGIGKFCLTIFLSQSLQKRLQIGEKHAAQDISYHLANDRPMSVSLNIQRVVFFSRSFRA